MSGYRLAAWAVDGEGFDVLLGRISGYETREDAIVDADNMLAGDHSFDEDPAQVDVHDDRGRWVATRPSSEKGPGTT